MVFLLRTAGLGGGTMEEQLTLQYSNPRSPRTCTHQLPVKQGQKAARASPTCVNVSLAVIAFERRRKASPA